MKEYGTNKIFVEGISDKHFIDFLLNNFFKIDDSKIVIDVEGKDNLKNQPLITDSKRVDEKAKNLIIFDTDSIKLNGGREQRLKEIREIEKELETEFKIFLLPFDDNQEGILENLLDNCLNDKFNYFNDCWENMIECANKSELKKLNLPAQKAFLYSKIDLFKNYRKKDWGYKDPTKYDYSDDNIWNFNPKEKTQLKKIIDFIETNLFNPIDVANNE